MLQRAGQGCAIETGLWERISQPSREEGQRTGALGFGDQRAMAATTASASSSPTPNSGIASCHRCSGPNNPPAPIELRHAFWVIENRVDDYLERARLGLAA